MKLEPRNAPDIQIAPLSPHKSVLRHRFMNAAQLFMNNRLVMLHLRTGFVNKTDRQFNI